MPTGDREPGAFYLVREAVLPLQGDFGAVQVAFAMRSLVLLLAGLFASAALIYGEIKLRRMPQLKSLQPGKPHMKTAWRPPARTSRFISGTRTFTPTTHSTIPPHMMWS